MTTQATNSEDNQNHVAEVVRLFESIVGASGIQSRIEQVGPKQLLRLVVGRNAPIYDYAIQQVRERLSDNPFSGLVRLALEPQDRFPTSVEASALAILLARATRPVSQGERPEGFVVPYVPFQNREDHKVAQPATQLIVGRRGVGKSTLVMRAREMLSAGANLIATIDCQAYSELAADALHREVVGDLLHGIRDAALAMAATSGRPIDTSAIDAALVDLETPEFDIRSSAPRLRRLLSELTKQAGGQAYLFIDDFHLVEFGEQPGLLQFLHGVAKGANGWLKVAGLRSLLNHYDPKTRKGLQIPGDAQLVSLDLTLENPQAAEQHLAAILGTFMSAVGYASYASVLPSPAFRRLVWANAGVPRDFLQMFARSLEHSGKARNASVTLGDVNISIGEFGQRKLDEMREDARNEQGRLRRVVDYLLDFCLAEKEPRVNAFLVRTEAGEERTLIATLSDLRLLHLIHQSITPDRAGETYQAYILDYSLFTGFRRKRNVKEMVPDEGEQFKASALRQLKKLPTKFLSTIDDEAEIMPTGAGPTSRGRRAAGTAGAATKQVQRASVRKNLGSANKGRSSKQSRGGRAGKKISPPASTGVVAGKPKKATGSSRKERG